MNDQRVLEIRDLKTHFFTYEGVAKAVDGVSYQLAKGEPLGVVGESGYGKSVTALSILRLIPIPPGKIVEEAKTKTLFENPQHPYTEGLLQSIPRLGDKVRHGKVRLSEIPGVVPSLYEPAMGCKFSTRCPFTMDICREKEPELKEIEAAHFSSCWLTNQ
jgi:oligopeptide/dipeptide ABC transporter ATP-binding protein